jgi:excisionase family DNA binding protein
MVFDHASWDEPGRERMRLRRRGSDKTNVHAISQIMKADKTTSGVPGGGNGVVPFPLRGHSGCGADSLGLLDAAKLTVPQAARRLGIGETKMRAIIKSGSIPVLDVAGKILIIERDLEEYMRERHGIVRRAPICTTERSPLPDSIAKSRYLS